MRVERPISQRPVEHVAHVERLRNGVRVCGYESDNGTCKDGAHDGFQLTDRNLAAQDHERSRHHEEHGRVFECIVFFRHASGYDGADRHADQGQAVPSESRSHDPCRRAEDEGRGSRQYDGADGQNLGVSAKTFGIGEYCDVDAEGKKHGRDQWKTARPSFCSTVGVEAAPTSVLVRRLMLL